MNGEILFREKYGIEYKTLIPIEKRKNNGMYDQNYKILYDKNTDILFTLWNSPYKHYIYIENEGFIIRDDELKKYYSTVNETNIDKNKITDAVDENNIDKNKITDAVDENKTNIIR